MSWHMKLKTYVAKFAALQNIRTKLSDDDGKTRMGHARIGRHGERQQSSRGLA